MGTEVLQPQDILSARRLGSSPSTAGAAAFFPRRRQSPGAASAHGPNPNPRPNRRPEHRKRREVSPRPAKNGGGSHGHMEMGQVTILRRGESLDAAPGGAPRTKPQKGERRGGQGSAVVLSSDDGGDLGVSGTGRGRAEAEGLPKETRLAEVRTRAKGERVETYAGSAFSLSPSPRALPLPTFSARKSAEGGAAVDHSATRDLRRLLRLD